MPQRVVDLDEQLMVIDAALTRNRLEAAAEELLVLFQDRNNRVGRLVEEGHVERILGAIAEKEPALAVDAAQRLLKIAPVLMRPAIVDSLLSCANSSSDKNRPLALKALFTAASYTGDDPERRAKAVRQYLACAEKWKNADAKSAFDAVAKAGEFAGDDPGLQIEVQEARATLSL